MGGPVYTADSHSKAVDTYVSSTSHITQRAEKKAYETGKLDPQVDPAENGVIRESKPRYIRNEQLGLWELEVGVPVPIETHLDTTGSMEDNVDLALKALPQMYKLCSSMLPGYQLQLAIGIFADVMDRFVLCRPKFADSAERIVERLTLMVPEGGGKGNGGEDPQYGLFGAAYLTKAYLNKFGFKGYDFTISDEPGRSEVYADQLIRVFGPNVFDKVAENGHKIKKNDLPSTKEIVRELYKRTHAFFIQIKYGKEGYWKTTTDFWKDVYGEDHVILLPNISYLPHVQALVVGLTEGTLTISNAAEFLVKNGIGEDKANEMVRSVSHIPIGAQAVLRSKLDRPLPQKGDMFKEKLDVDSVKVDDTLTSFIDPKGTKQKIEWL